MDMITLGKYFVYLWVGCVIFFFCLLTFNALFGLLVDDNENPVAGPGLEPVGFPEQNTVYAKDQPEYKPLPAYVDQSSDVGSVVTCWRLPFRDRIKILLTGRLWLSTWTFRQPLQPLYLSVDKSDVLQSTEPVPDK